MWLMVTGLSRYVSFVEFLKAPNFEMGYLVRIALVFSDILGVHRLEAYDIHVDVSGSE